MTTRVRVTVIEGGGQNTQSFANIIYGWSHVADNAKAAAPREGADAEEAVAEKAADGGVLQKKIGWERVRRERPDSSSTNHNMERPKRGSPIYPQGTS